MAAQSETEAGVICDQVFAFRRRSKLRPWLRRRRVLQQMRQGTGAGAQPMGVVPVPRECGERAGGSEGAQVAPAQLGTPGKVGDVFKSPLPARCDYPPGA